MTELDWRQKAECRGKDGDSWHPPRMKGRSIVVARAIRVCAGCPVRRECAAFALDSGQATGVYGGVDLGAHPRRVRPTKNAALLLRAVAGRRQ